MSVQSSVWRACPALIVCVVFQLTCRLLKVSPVCRLCRVRFLSLLAVRRRVCRAAVYFTPQRVSLSSYSPHIFTLSLSQLTPSGGAASSPHRSVSSYSPRIFTLPHTAHSFRLCSVSLWLTYETTGNVI